MAVLMGGLGAERAVSLSTGQECATALRQAGYRVVHIDAGADLVAHLQRVQPAVVFNALHGRWGEGGCGQGLLGWMQIAYTHSGVLSSALAMDKDKTKEVFRAQGLPVLERLLIASPALAEIHPIPPPSVLKPHNDGSPGALYLVDACPCPPPPHSQAMPGTCLGDTSSPSPAL